MSRAASACMRWAAQLCLLLAILVRSSVSSAAEVPAAPLTLQLRWRHQFQFAGYYLALERGFYREAGLEVRIRELSAGQNAVDEVLAGRADVGVGTSDLLLERDKGRPVVVLGVLFQHSPLALAVRSDRGIGNVHQLAGRKLMIEPGSAELVGLLRREGVPLSKLTTFEHSLSLREFAQGEADAMTVYSTDEPFALARDGVPYQLFSARQAGIDFYGDNLFTSESELSRRPHDLAAFRDASMRGWRAAFDDPEAAIQLILARYRFDKPVEHLRFEAKQMRELVMPDVVDPGYVSTGRWSHIADTYRELGLLSAPIDLERFLYRPKPAPSSRWLTYALAAAGVLLVLSGAYAGRLYLAQRRLHQAQVRLRAFIDGTPTPLIVARIADGNIRYANERAAAVFGLERSELLGRDARELYADPSAREALIEAVRAGGGVCEREVLFRKHDGGELWCIVSSSLSSYDGTAVLLSGLVDVGERRRLEAELRSALEEIRTLRGIISICSFCKRVRTDEGAWDQIERYVTEHSHAVFSHGLCPECMVKHYPEYADEP